jgi:hypothetical protein
MHFTKQMAARFSNLFFTSIIVFQKTTGNNQSLTKPVMNLNVVIIGYAVSAFPIHLTTLTHEKALFSESIPYPALPSQLLR